MLDLIYRIDPTATGDAPPMTAQEAQDRLEAGNRDFANLQNLYTATATTTRIINLNADALGLPGPDGSPPKQRPFAAVLGCADARVPIELIFGQAANDLFVVRVAGNVLGAECLGSLDYAISNLSGLKLVVVLGHSACGAVSAAVEAFMNPHTYLDFAKSHPLRAVIERIMVGVRAAHRALEQVYSQDVEECPGYREALIETTIVLNAAMTAATIRSEFETQMGENLNVVFGIYNLVSRRVKLKLEEENDVTVRLTSPPTDADGFDKLGILIAGSGLVKRLLLPA